MRRRTRHNLALLLLALLIIVPGLSACSASDGEPDPSTAAPESTQYRGFALPTYTREGYASLEARNSLNEIATAGAQWVQFTPTFYQESGSASVIAERGSTPSDESVEAAVRAAHDAGLKVMLKPHVDLINSTNRADIRPADRAGWFTSYEAFISRYAELAARTGVESFVVGTELQGLSSDREAWLRVVSVVRSRFTGILTYAANYPEYRGVAFWDVLDLIGVDAYFPLSGRPTIDAAALEAEWVPLRRELADFSVKTGKSVLFTEVGYTSQRGATTAPYSWTVSEQPDEAEQAAAYDALLTTFVSERWWAGVIWWCWNIPLGGDSNGPLGYTPRGKAAEEVINEWWR